MRFSLVPERPRSALRYLCCLCLSLSLLCLTVGCTKGKRSIDNYDVTGKVLYKGRGLPGGRVTFVSVNGGFTGSGTIAEDGTYKIKAPMGPVKISVDNRTLQSHQMVSRSGQQRPPGEQAEMQAMKGHYVSIPPKYYDPEASQLTYDVQAAEQTHDIELNDKRM
jgi:hypothetical protein